MDLKKWTLLVAMMGVLLATAFANDGNEINKSRADFMKERRAYFIENIKPKIDAKRNILEASISVEDSKEIARLNKEIREQRLIQNEFMSEARVSQIKGEEIDDGIVDEIRAQRIVIENLYDKAKIIANNYRPEIDDLLAELREEGQEWQGQMRPGQGEFYGRQQFNGRRGMGPQFSETNGPGYGSMGPQSSGQNGQGYGSRGRSFGHMGAGFGPGSQGGFGIVTFLLWDVNHG